MKLILDNGKEITLSQELASKIKEEIKANGKPRNFATLEDKTHWWVNKYNELIEATYMDNETIKNYLAFTNEEFAKKVAFKQLMERKLLAFKDEFDDETLDWNDNSVFKYRLCYDIKNKNIVVNHDSLYKQQGAIYFSSREIAEKCIEMYKDDLIKYFEMDIW